MAGVRELATSCEAGLQGMKLLEEKFEAKFTKNNGNNGKENGNNDDDG